MKKIQIEDILKFNFMSNIVSNEDKTVFSFVKSMANKENDNYLQNIFVYFLESNKFVQLTSSNTDYLPTFIDNENLIFISNRDVNKYKNDTKFYKINIYGGEAVEYFTLPIKVSEIIPYGDDKFIILSKVNRKNPKVYELSDEERHKYYEEYDKKLKREDEIDEIPFCLNNVGFNYDLRSAIFLFDKSTNKLELITDFEKNATLQDFDKENNKLLISYRDYEKDVVVLYNSLEEYDLNTKIFKHILDNKILSINTAFYQKGKVFVFGSEMLKHGKNENPKIYEIKNQKINLVYDNDLSLFNTIGTDTRYGREIELFNLDNKEFYYLQTKNYYCDLYKFSNDTVEQVTDLKGSIDGFVFLKDKLIVLGYFNNKLQEFYEIKDGKLNQISNFNAFLDEYETYTPEIFTYESNGSSIDGFVIKPANYEEGKKYPCILDIHGGPKTVYSNIYYHEMQYFASNGYFVIFTNPHGSDGRGNEYLDIFGKYGSIDYEDLMTFVDEAIKRYSGIDENKLAVTGGSYGGFMTNWIVTHTDRFKVAVTQRSICNWVSFYGTSDIGFYFATDQMRADFSQKSDFETMWKFSPLKYIDNAKTPLLILHSDEDYRCPVEQAYQMFTAYKHKGNDSKLVVFKGENHELSRSGKPNSRFSRLNNIMSWIDKYIK